MLSCPSPSPGFQQDAYVLPRKHCNFWLIGWLRKWMINRIQRSLTILVNSLLASGKSCSFHFLDPLLSCNKPFFFNSCIPSDIYSAKARPWHQGALRLNPSSSTAQLYNARQVIWTLCDSVFLTCKMDVEMPTSQDGWRIRCDGIVKNTEERGPE